MVVGGYGSSLYFKNAFSSTWYLMKIDDSRIKFIPTFARGRILDDEVRFHQLWRQYRASEQRKKSIWEAPVWPSNNCKTRRKIIVKSGRPRKILITYESYKFWPLSTEIRWSSLLESGRTLILENERFLNESGRSSVYESRRFSFFKFDNPK